MEALKKAYSFRRHEKNYEIFLNSIRKIQESCVNDLIEYALEGLPPGHDDFSVLKQKTLDGNIGFLSKKKIIPSSIYTHMHVLRLCGNQASHSQEETIDGCFVEYGDRSMRAMMQWYAKEYLQLDVDVDEFLKDAPVTLVVGKPDAKGIGGKKRKNRMVQTVMSTLMEYGLQILIIVIATLILYFVVNKIGILK